MCVVWLTGQWVLLLRPSAGDSSKEEEAELLRMGAAAMWSNVKHFRGLHLEKEQPPGPYGTFGQSEKAPITCAEEAIL